jgi:protein transport protein SEC31
MPNGKLDLYRCPRNPDLSIVASFDGKVAIHSLQSNSEHYDDAFSPAQSLADLAPADADDPFAQVGGQDLTGAVDNTKFTLPYAPKWLKRPVGCSWGFGGRLVHFDNKSKEISVKTIISDKNFSESVDELEETLLDPESATEYCHKKAAACTSEKDKDVWLFLKTTFALDSREDMLDFLGFDKNFSSRYSPLTLVTSMLHFWKSSK